MFAWEELFVAAAFHDAGPTPKRPKFNLPKSGTLPVALSMRAQHGSFDSTRCPMGPLPLPVPAHPRHSTAIRRPRGFSIGLMGWARGRGQGNS